MVGHVYEGKTPRHNRIIELHQNVVIIRPKLPYGQYRLFVQAHVFQFRK